MIAERYLVGVVQVLYSIASSCLGRADACRPVHLPLCMLIETLPSVMNDLFCVHTASQCLCFIHSCIFWQRLSRRRLTATD